MLTTSLLHILGRQQAQSRLKAVGNPESQQANAEGKHLEGITSRAVHEVEEPQIAATGLLQPLVPDLPVLSSTNPQRAFEEFVKAICYFDKAAQRPLLDIFE